jgi:hypothetical protein
MAVWNALRTSYSRRTVSVLVVPQDSCEAVSPGTAPAPRRADSPPAGFEADAAHGLKRHHGT